MARLRHKEAEQALRELGSLELVQFGLPEGTWRAATLYEHLATLLERTQPTIVYTTSPIDYHPDHKNVAPCLSRCLQDHSLIVNPIVRIYEVQVPLTPVLANRIAHTTSVTSKKKRAIASYRTQLPSLRWLPRLERYNRRLYRALGPIELFCELTVPQFAALCREAEKHDVGYFGMRSRPFSDPLAWLIGWRARQHLSRAGRVQDD
jgi:LmbE family N-acetylglucosaminyl deacetylase